MPAPDREAVQLALLARMQQYMTGVSTWLRRYVDPTSLNSSQQPAVILIADRYQIVDKVRGRPNVWKTHVQVLVYARVEESADTPETQLHQLLGQLENAMSRQDSEAITDMTNPTDTNLGGLVSRVSFSGDVDLIPGDSNGQGALVVPLEILIRPT